jgi:hypothetical protein
MNDFMACGGCYLFMDDIVFTSQRGRRGHDRMLVGFTTTCAIGIYHH